MSAFIDKTIKLCQIRYTNFLISFHRRFKYNLRSRVITRDILRFCCYGTTQQFASSLFATICIRSVVDNLHQVCSRQLASGLFATICIRSVRDNLHQACSRQFASSLFATICIRSVCDNLHQVCSRQLVTSLLTSCSRLVVNKLLQAMRTHPDIGLLTTSLLQEVNRLVATCAFVAVYYRNATSLLQLDEINKFDASC